LEREAELVAQRLYLVYCLISKRKWGRRREDGQEVVQVMLQFTRHVPLNYPVKGLCKEVKDIRGRLKTECQNDCVIEAALPLKAEKLPVSGPDWNVVEGFF
jgi:hypothetical protein